MKKSTVKSTKCSLLAARKAGLQRRRRLGIDLGEAGLGPERIRGGFSSRIPRGSRSTASTAASNFFQNAENFVLKDVDITTAGGNVERHEHIHIHIHIVQAPRRRPRGSAASSDVFHDDSVGESCTGGLRRSMSPRKGGDDRVNDRKPRVIIAFMAPNLFFFLI
ncbi:hypothetical protein DFP72DRAFT_1045830 [Ephemerocybe angulata]|uniref:Uncharacterized protein n=1 Tax=Ephemerocybe angulata TaxID=980116 RepID=A0A8H6HYG3_9AGAR|nr:hypothetical protein DFP72DRAFT_1045830 [Tulosesus angulatus]